MSDFNTLINERIAAAVTQTVAERLAPLNVLEAFDGVEVLTFDEVMTVLRLTESELLTGIASGSVPVQKIGRNKTSWRFPKRQIAAFLLGDWKPEKVVRKQSSTLVGRAVELVG